MPSIGLEALIVIAATLAVGGFVKGVTGAGLPLITVPVLAGYFGVERAVLLMIIPSLTLNLIQVITHRDEVRALPELRRLLLAGVPGAIFGASVLYLASDTLLATGLAVCILAYVILRLAHPSFALGMQARMRWSPAVGAVAGALQAATGISAPVVAAYVDALGLKPRAYVFAVCACFGAYAATHFAFVAASGSYTVELLTQSLLAVIPAVALTPVGIRARGLLPPRGFEILIRITLVIMAARLLYSAWMPQPVD